MGLAPNEAACAKSQGTRSPPHATGAVITRPEMNPALQAVKQDGWVPTDRERAHLPCDRAAAGLGFARGSGGEDRRAPEYPQGGHGLLSVLWREGALFLLGGRAH